MAETCGGTSRRCFLQGTAGAAGALVLAACAPSDGGPPQGGATGEAPAADGGLVAVGDVPVGGAVPATGPDGPLVVAQPQEGTFVAFSAVCTHEGCTVTVDGEELVCPCHGSLFDIATGENLDGPAPEPLPEVAVEVRDGQVVLA